MIIRQPDIRTKLGGAVPARPPLGAYGAPITDGALGGRDPRIIPPAPVLPAVIPQARPNGRALPRGSAWGLRRRLMGLDEQKMSLVRAMIAAAYGLDTTRGRP